MIAGTAQEFIRTHTRLGSPALVPEVRLYLADEPFGLWERTQQWFLGQERPLPFWAFAWAGGQALARYVLDRPDVVRGRRVFDLAAGSGMLAIVAMKAGGAVSVANEIDELALAAISLNAAANRVDVSYCDEDVLGGDGLDLDVVLAGDVFYERAMANRVLPWLRRAGQGGAIVLVGDPGRRYFPESHFEAMATYDVAVSSALEDRQVKATTVWRLKAGAALIP